MTGRMEVSTCNCRFIELSPEPLGPMTARIHNPYCRLHGDPHAPGAGEYYRRREAYWRQLGLLDEATT